MMTRPAGRVRRGHPDTIVRACCCGRHWCRILHAVRCGNGAL